MLEQDITINTENMTLSVDIMDMKTNCVIVICDGKAKVRELPEHGEYRIVTHQGKVKRMRSEEREEF